MINLLLLSTWFIPIVFNAWFDHKRVNIDYLIVFFFRGIAAILHAIIYQIPESFGYGEELFWQIAPLFVFQTTSFWIFFELFLNIFRHRRSLDYNGLLYFDRKENNSGWIDRWFSKRPLWVHSTAKIMCFVLMVLSIIVIYYR